MTAAQDRANRQTHLRDKFRSATQIAAETIGTHHQPDQSENVSKLKKSNHIGHTWDQCWPRDIIRLVSLDAALLSTGLCSDGLRLPSVMRKSFSVLGQMAEKEFWKRRHERYTWYMDACVRQVDRWGSSSAMVWAAISADHRSDLVFIDSNLNAVCYRDEILGQFCCISWSESEVVLCSSMITPILMRLVYAPISWWRMTFTYYSITMVCRQSRPEWIPS